MERNLDFDEVIERKNTKCLKYDFNESYNVPENVLALWVADMDFKTSSYVEDALKDRVNHGIYGYSDTDSEYFFAVRDWVLKQYKWELDKEWMVKTPGVIFAIVSAIQSLTEENDAVIIQQPVYYPFGDTVKRNNRKLVINELYIGDDNKYHIDFEDFERKIREENVKLFVLCNPQNPVGRVWTREELEKLGDICLKYNVKVVSDEIHADFVFNGNFTSFFSIKEEYRDIGIVCTSPSKTFNLAGLQVSNIFIPNRHIRKLIEKKIYNNGYCELNIMGILACEAAYKNGGVWYEAVKKYIGENIKFARTFIKEQIPKLSTFEHEGTYLLWIDFRKLGLSVDKLDDLIVNKAGLWLESGEIFGKCGKGFQRINVACPRIILEKALVKLKNVINDCKRFD